jgi:hypothetical protein
VIQFNIVHSYPPEERQRSFLFCDPFADTFSRYSGRAFTF